MPTKISMYARAKRSSYFSWCVVAAVLTLLVFMPVQAGESLAPAVIAKVKRATVYVVVESAGSQSSGSGFVVLSRQDAVYIATNCHVLGDRDVLRSATPKEAAVAIKASRIKVVFNAGEANEFTTTAEVVAIDQANDLAICRCITTGLAAPPAPLDCSATANTVETMPVFVFGFPFGEVLATNGKSPAVTVGKATVSSIRTDENGDVAIVQIDGTLNPGNSGGPIVDEAGKLVGIAVAGIANGEGVGLAIPAAQLARDLDGRLGTAEVADAVEDQGKKKFKIEVPVIDINKNIKAVTLYYLDSKTADPPPKGELSSMPGSRSLQMNVVDGVASGEIVFDKIEGTLWFQVARAGAKAAEARIQKYAPDESLPAVASVVRRPNLDGPPGETYGEDVGPKGGVFVGFEGRTGMIGGNDAVCSMWPIYRVGDKEVKGALWGKGGTKPFRAVAAPGYAVGAQIMSHSPLLNGFGLIFLKISGNRLDTFSKIQASEWIGNQAGNSKTTTHASGGQVVAVKIMLDRDNRLTHFYLNYLAPEPPLPPELADYHKGKSLAPAPPVDSTMDGDNRSAMVGYIRGEIVVDRAEDKALLVGFDLILDPGEFGKSDKMKSVRPVFRAGDKETRGKAYGMIDGKSVTIVAKAGYAVGGVQVDGNHVQGINVTFMKVTDKGLDPKDAYESGWIGVKGNEESVKLDGKGRRVLGIRANTNEWNLLGLGLIFTPNVEERPVPTEGDGRELIDEFLGEGRRRGDGVVTLTRAERVRSSEVFAPPVAFKIVAMTDSAIRLAYGAEAIIFNGNGDRLEINGGPLGSRNSPGAGSVPVGKWVEFDLEVQRDAMIIRVGGKERYREKGDFSKIMQPISIFPGGATIGVKSVKVRSMKPEPAKQDPAMASAMPYPFEFSNYAWLEAIAPVPKRETTMEDANVSNLIGFPIRASVKSDVVEADGVLVGFNVLVGKKEGQNAPIKTLQPVYRVNGKETLGKKYGKGGRKLVTVVAKEGYAVGAVDVVGAMEVTGFNVTFMKIIDGRLNPQDKYTSEWIGDEGNDETPHLEAKGRQVIGIRTRHDDWGLKALGLIFRRQEQRLTSDGRELVNDLVGKGRRRKSGVVVLGGASRDKAQSVESFLPPVAFKVVAMTDATDLCLSYAAGSIVFNWNDDPNNLRVNEGPLGGQHKPGAGAVPTRQWVEIDLEVQPDVMIIRVDGQERYREKGDFSKIDEPFAIFSAGRRADSMVGVKSVKVRSVKSGLAKPEPDVARATPVAPSNQGANSPLVAPVPEKPEPETEPVITRATPVPPPTQKPDASPVAPTPEKTVPKNAPAIPDPPAEPRPRVVREHPFPSRPAVSDSGKPPELVGYDQAKRLTRAPQAAIAPADRPAANDGVERELINELVGSARRRDDGVILLRWSDRAQTPETFKPPVAFKIVAMTDSTNIRLAFLTSVIFNWEMRRDDLRIDNGPLAGRHKKGAGAVPVGKWVEIDLEVQPDGMIIRVDGEERYREKADFSRVEQPLQIFTLDTTIAVKSVKVRTPKP